MKALSASALIAAKSINPPMLEVTYPWAYYTFKKEVVDVSLLCFSWEFWKLLRIVVALQGPGWAEELFKLHGYKNMIYILDINLTEVGLGY